MKNKIKLIWLSLAVVLISILAYFGLKDDRVTYMTVRAEKRSLVDRVVADGQINAYQVVDVGAQVSGKIEKLHVKLGDKVKKGDLLAEIEATVKENALKVAEYEVVNLKAQLSAKKASYRQAFKDFKRQEKLYGKGDVAKIDFERAQTTLEVQKEEIQSLEAQIIKGEIAVSSARIDLGYTKITAPIEGVVTSVVTQEGQTVISAQQATTILVLKDLSKVTVKARISEADIHRVKPGMPVYFTTIGEPEVKHYGTLRVIEPDDKLRTRISDQSASVSVLDEAVYYNGLFEVGNLAGNFYPAMTVEVSIIIEEARNVLSIPITAVHEDNGKTWVEVLYKNAPKRQDVVLGVNDRVYVEIKKGLTQEDQIIIADSTGSNVKTMKKGRAF